MGSPEIAENITCIHCGKSLIREDPSDSFFSCRGYEEFIHPLYRVSSTFVNGKEELKLEEASDKISEGSEP